MQKYLNSTLFFDYDQQSVQVYADTILGSHSLSKCEIASRLYLAVRDDILYNPYVYSFDPKSYTASYCLSTKESYCIPKAILLGAMARYKGIPSRLGLADVKNHLSSQKLLDFLKSDIFVMHGYIELYLNDRWVKATPAFNASLCKKTGVQPLAFNGVDDSVFHEFNSNNVKHMEYICDHGVFDDVPVDFIQESVMTAYPHLSKSIMKEHLGHQSLSDDFNHEV